MSDRKFAFKASTLVFKSQIVAVCDMHKVALEDWETRHVATLQAEMGKLGISSSKAGYVTLGKGCETAREGIANSYRPGGKGAHASLRFYRECLVATAYVDEFGKSAHIGLTDESARYVENIVARVAGKATATENEAKAEAVPAKA